MLMDLVIAMEGSNCTNSDRVLYVGVHHLRLLLSLFGIDSALLISWHMHDVFIALFHLLTQIHSFFWFALSGYLSVGSGLHTAWFLMSIDIFVVTLRLRTATENLQSITCVLNCALFWVIRTSTTWSLLAWWRSWNSILNRSDGSALIRFNLVLLWLLHIL
jgi:hypothetical protein